MLLLLWVPGGDKRTVAVTTVLCLVSAQTLCFLRGIRVSHKQPGTPLYSFYRYMCSASPGETTGSEGRRGRMSCAGSSINVQP
jgi:hypothetical protein